MKAEIDTKEKMKKRIVYIIVAAIALAIIVGIGHHLYTKQQAKIDNAQRKIMKMMGFDDTTTWEDFLIDENMPTALARVEPYMDEVYPELKGNPKYKDITIERLKTDFMNVYEEIRPRNYISKKDYNIPYKEYDFGVAVDETVGEYIAFGVGYGRDGVYDEVKYQMRMDGIWVGDGAEKVDEDSEVAIMRKSKAGCMRVFKGVGEDYAFDYIYYGYKDSNYEMFLASEQLPEMLIYFQKLMDEQYPQIGYGSKYKEITIMRLTTDYEAVYKELEEISVEIKKAGGNWRRINVEIAGSLREHAKAEIIRYLWDDKQPDDTSIFRYGYLHDNMPIFLEEFKTYMQDNYPDIGYGTKYEEFTLERLDDEHMSVYQELKIIEENMKIRGLDLKKDVADKLWNKIKETEAEEEMADERMAMERHNALKKCVGFIHGEKEPDDFYINAWSEELETDTNALIFLAEMKKYMENHYADIEYGTKYEEITIPRLKEEYIAVSYEMKKIEKEFIDRGEDWYTVRSKIIGKSEVLKEWQRMLEKDKKEKGEFD